MKCINEEKRFYPPWAQENSSGINNNQQLFCCPRCYKQYNTYRQAKAHFLKCYFKPVDSIYSNEDTHIAKLSENTPRKYKETIDNLGFASKQYQKIDFQLTRKNFDSNFAIYILLNPDFLIGYITYQSLELRKRNNKLFKPWILWDFYIIPTERHKGRGKSEGHLLFEKSIADLGIKRESLFFNIPLTEDS